MSVETEQRLYDALKRITAYMPPEKLEKVCEKKYGLERDEAIEMAYENVLSEAAQAIKGMQRPKPKATRSTPSIGRSSDRKDGE
jgi:hypothetical protein